MLLDPGRYYHADVHELELSRSAEPRPQQMASLYGSNPGFAATLKVAADKALDLTGSWEDHHGLFKHDCLSRTFCGLEDNTFHHGPGGRVTTGLVTGSVLTRRGDRNDDAQTVVASPEPATPSPNLEPGPGVG